MTENGILGHTTLKHRYKETLLAFIIITVTILIYHAFFWNKYLGLQDGWGNVYAAYLEHGKIPYRDFYLFSQPYSILLSTFITHVFGNTIIALRAWGIGERIVITFFLYLILRRIVNYSTALLIAVAALIFSTATFVETVYEYGQTCFLFILLSTYLVSTAIIYYQNGIIHNARKYILAAGLAGGFAFITKQSIGLIIPFATIVFLVLFESSQSKRFRIQAAMYYAITFVLPSLITLLIIYRFNATTEYFNQVFLSAAASKGGLTTVLFGALTRYAWMLLKFGIFAAIFVFLFALNKRKANLDSENYLLPTLVILFAILSGYFATYYFISLDAAKIFFFNKHQIFSIIFTTNILLALYLLCKILITKINTEEWQWFLIAAIATSMIYGQGFSSEYDMRSTALGIGVVLALLFSLYLPFLNKEKNLLLCVYCAFIIGGATMQHYLYPYLWWGWMSESVRESYATVPLKPLAGIKMSDYTAQVFSEITQIVRSNTTPTDTIYVFPHMPLFYLLADRYPSTWAITDYMDVCSDACAKEDAARILKMPPKVLIIENFTESAWISHEKTFRNGNRSGQRDILVAMNNLIQHYAYKKMLSLPSTIKNFNIVVWVRGSDTYNE